MSLTPSAAAEFQKSPLKVSFEFFPPKTDEMEARLWETVAKIEPISPAFVSVTYGAGGSTRDRTHRTVARLVDETGLSPAAHLTCVAASREEVDEVARNYHAAGIRHVVALRGDPPEGAGTAYRPHPGGYSGSADLVAGLRRIADFEVSVGCYPEKHPESPSLEHDLDLLKAKVDAGATRAITQFFFTADTFLRFRDRAIAAGISIPIVPGIMLQANFKGLARMAALCGTTVPDRIAGLYDGLDDDPATRTAITAQLAAELCGELTAGGVDAFHFYTLNRADLALATARLLHLTSRLDRVAA